MGILSHLTLSCNNTAQLDFLSLSKSPQSDRRHSIWPFQPLREPWSLSRSFKEYETVIELNMTFYNRVKPDLKFSLNLLLGQDRFICVLFFELSYLDFTLYVHLSTCLQILQGFRLAYVSLNLLLKLDLNTPN